jgi:hypothetical protein
MADIRMGYMGNLTVNGVQYLCSEMTAVPETKPQFFDHVVGLRDKDFGQKKGPASDDDPLVGGKKQVQKKFWRYTPVTYKVTASGPIADGMAWALLNPAISGKPNSIECLFWNDGKKRSVSKAIISSFQLTANAGDVATFTIEAVGKDMTLSDGETTEVNCTKLLTWDRIEVEVLASESLGDVVNISNFNLSVNNPILPIYTAGSLKPYDLRIGVQEVTGSVSIYGMINKMSVLDGIRFNLGYGDYKIGAVFTPQTARGVTGPFIVSIPFTGSNDSPVWRDVAGVYP